MLTVAPQRSQSDLSTASSTSTPSSMYPQRDPEENQLVLRHFLFSIMPGRRVPPIARAHDRNGKASAAAEAVAQRIGEAFDDGQRYPQVKKRITASHAQELVAVSRTLRGDTGDMPENKPLELGTLAQRSIELHQYHQRCMAAVNRSTTRRQDGLAGDEAAVQRVTVAGLTRDARRRLQLASRTYSVEPSDYANTAAYDAAMENEEFRAVAAFLEGQAAGRRRRHRLLKPRAVQAPKLRTSGGSDAAASQKHSSQKTTVEPINVNVQGIDVVDASPARLPPRATHSADHRSRPATALGNQSVNTTQSRGTEFSPASSPRSKRFIGGKKTAAQLRARRELVEPSSKATSLATKVLQAKEADIEKLQCFPAPAPASPTFRSKDVTPLSHVSASGARSASIVETPILPSEFSRRTCVHDCKPPRRLLDVLRMQLEGTPSPLIGLADKMNSPSDAMLSSYVSLSGTFSSKDDEARQQQGSSLSETVPSLRRNRAAAHLAIAINEGRRCVTPSITGPRSVDLQGCFGVMSNSRSI